VSKRQYLPKTNLRAANKTKKNNPDPHQSKKPDPDMHQSQKPDQDLPQNQTSGAVEAQYGAVEGLETSGCRSHHFDEEQEHPHQND
jgi:hypothetical protein